MIAFKSLSNKYLIVKPYVTLTSELDITISQVDKYFKEANLKSFVTSALRSVKDQMRIIIGYATKINLSINFEVNDIDKKENEVYIWQPTWSKLMSMGYLIAPPREARLLFDRIIDGVNTKNKLYRPSKHFIGKAFDIEDGDKLTPLDIELNVIEKAAKDIKSNILNYTLERQNNCIHINIK